jgi:hypothetical protein
MLSGLFLAAMSVDRLIAVRFPMKAPTLCTAGKAKKTVFAFSLLITTLNLHIFYVLHYIVDRELGRYHPGLPGVLTSL